MSRYPDKWKKADKNVVKRWTRWVVLSVTILILLFIGIGVLTGAKTTYRLYSDTIQEWTAKLKGGSFIYLFEMENRVFRDAHPEGNRIPGLTSLSFQLLTSLTPNDPRSLLGREIPGLSSYNSQIIIAGQGTDFSTLPIESEPPLEVEDRGEEGDIEEQEDPGTDQEAEPAGEDSVYIYHTHNTESFYPHLPDETTVYDGKVNITLVGDRLGQSLERRGVGAVVDKTDVAALRSENGMEYYQSYDAVRPVVEEAVSSNGSLTYFFDLHRDSLAREHTTTTIDGKDYARFAFVIGAEHPGYEKNLAFATALHNKLEETYPGISRGVITKKGSGVDGVYNQDINPNAILIEFGGVYNNLDELYRSADIMAEVFSDYYFDEQKVTKEP
ncbi:stage II sporulation protein P [Halobacillus kuroshimensis]|uniref:Stage II sporulation protein P n=1 Tax=Halobacillus kuroshimensis TaxID=302481 RepID=A0ABS3DZC3_9BACI|nr:stage II sporulation protein P [Halobacillus kuroshimensis]MBN8236691.1 stage II sporulation protein P [Halobacillus kuroshimensis]